MGFFHPTQLAWGVLAALVVLLYLVWRKTPHDVSSNVLWQRALARRSTWRRFQRPLSAAIFVLLVVLLAGAAAEPYWRSERAQARNVVVVLDTSASMRAIDVGPNRLTWAKEQAHLLVDDLRPYEQMAVLTAGGPTRLACGWSHDRQALHQAIDKTEPTDAADSMPDAIDLAHWMLAQQANPKIVVITDGCFADAASLSTGGDIQFITPDAPGSPARRPAVNFAITALAARLSPRLGDESDRRPIDQLLVEVANFSDHDAAIPLTIEASGQPVVELTVAVGAGRTAQRFVELNQNVRGLVTARIKVQDDLAADNEAWLTISRPQTGNGNKKPTLVLGQTTSDVIAIEPAGAARQLNTTSLDKHFWPVAAGLDRVGPLLWVGQWQIAPAAGGAPSSANPDAPGFVAVNLLNREESDLRPRANLKSSPLPLATAARRDPPGVWLLLGALVLCGGEWVLFQRRCTV